MAAFIPISARPILITGARGTLGAALARVCGFRGLCYVAVARQELDIADEPSVRRVLDGCQPWALINAAGYVRVAEAQQEVDACMRANVEGPRILARLCAERSIPLVSFSSDLVFDGALGRPYVESDFPTPLNVYGRSKALAEEAVLSEHPGAMIVRTSAFFGPWDEYNFVTLTKRALDHGAPVDALADAIVSPTYVPHLADAVLDLMLDASTGIWHLANQGCTSWYELARELAARCDSDASLIRACSREDGVNGVVLPAYSALGSARSWIMPSLSCALDAYFAGVC